MEYIFGTEGESEILKTKGSGHTSLSGWCETERRYADQIITDRFHVVGKTGSAEDDAGNCYDFYEIDRHYRTIDKSGPAAETASIAFVTMGEAGSIDDATAGEHAELFAPWAENVAYAVGNLRRYGSKLYRCIQAHTSQADWTPDAATSLWREAADPAEEWPEWSQPIGASDAYNAGAKVSHNGKHWTSDADGNVWEPGVYGWTEAS